MTCDLNSKRVEAKAFTDGKQGKIKVKMVDEIR